MPAPPHVPRAWSIRTRLLLLVFAVWLPAVAGFGLLARTTYEREERAARVRVQGLAQNLNTAIERELDLRMVMLRALASSSTLQQRQVDRFLQEARDAVAGTGNWVVLVDRERQLANTLHEQPTVVMRAAGSPFVREPTVVFTMQSPVKRKPVLAVVGPVRNSPDLNVAVAFEPTALHAVVRGQDYPEGTLATVLDHKHRIVARSREVERFLGVSASAEMQKRIVTTPAGFAPSVTLDGVASLTYVSHPNRHGWRVVMALPTAALTRSAERLTLQTSAASAALLLLGLGLALYAARRIAAPLSALQAAAQELGRDTVPPRLATGVAEADAVSGAMHEAGARLQASGRVLQQRVSEAVEAAEQAQARLLEGQKHEAIGRLTGGLAHDFNNLLQTINMGLQLVDRTVPEGRHTRAVRAALGACSKAADLVRQMLAFGRSQPLRPQPVPLADFLLKGQELTGKALGEGITLVAEIEPGLPAVLADPTQLELALLNLVFNARDAMPQGGRITLSARRAQVADHADLVAGDYVVLAVADQGTGMDEATQARVFEPYFTTKPVGAGTGLGLPQVLAFARQSGGDVRLSSALGRGTSVALVLPACTLEPAAGAHRVAHRSVDAVPLEVLMVEDDALVASVVGPALESQGHRVTLCRDADEAVAVLAGGAAFDVVFTDVVMPGSRNGLDLARWCRAHRPGLPVVLATGYTAQPIDLDVPVLRKPYDIDHVLAALQEAAGRAATVA